MMHVSLSRVHEYRVQNCILRLDQEEDLDEQEQEALCLRNNA